ncbi:hypothetical protein [Streptomyces sp. NPDC003077]|uniref:hypothetical protein n=1 Tax=Streptomyces sp. NPDC003077 TaxID=3154443 RepID=UPI0033B7DD3A
MNTARTGTIDRPSQRDPQKQDPTMNPFHTEATAPTHSDVLEARQNRIREMQLIPEALARAHIHERLRQAEADRRAVRFSRARRMQRRAERASLRARRALALAVMQ